MLSSNQIVYGSLIYSARKVFAQTPETISRMPVNRVGHHAKRDRAKLVCCELLGHERGDVAVLAIDTAHSVKLRTRCAPDAGRRPLLDRLQATSGERYFERPVSTMLPGWREKARTRCALARSSIASAKRMLAVFDWP